METGIWFAGSFPTPELKKWGFLQWTDFVTVIAIALLLFQVTQTANVLHSVAMTIQDVRAIALTDTILEPIANVVGLHV